MQEIVQVINFPKFQTWADTSYHVIMILTYVYKLGLHISGNLFPILNSVTNTDNIDNLWMVIIGLFNAMAFFFTDLQVLL